MKNKPKMEEMITRTFPAEWRADTKNGKIVGLPIVFGQSTDIGGWFEEEIERGAIDEKVLKDVAFFFNHRINDTPPFARTRNKKLRFNITDQGVEMEADVNRERTDANDLYLAIEDGDVDGMSFMFRVEKSRWEREDTDYPKRIIEKIGYVQEVSAVNYPAYRGTSIDVARSNDALDSDKEMVDAIKRRAKTGAGAPETRTEADALALELLKRSYLNRI